MLKILNCMCIYLACPTDATVSLDLLETCFSFIRAWVLTTNLSNSNSTLYELVWNGELFQIYEMFQLALIGPCYILWYFEAWILDSLRNVYKVLRLITLQILLHLWSHRLWHIRRSVNQDKTEDNFNISSTQSCYEQLLLHVLLYYGIASFDINKLARLAIGQQTTSRQSASATQRLQPSVCNLASAPQRLHPRICTPASVPQDLHPSVCNPGSASQHLHPRICTQASATQDLLPMICIPASATQDLHPSACISVSASKHLQPRIYTPGSASQGLQPRICIPAPASQDPYPRICTPGSACQDLDARICVLASTPQDLHSRICIPGSASQDLHPKIYIPVCTPRSGTYYSWRFFVHETSIASFKRLLKTHFFRLHLDPLWLPAHQIRLYLFMYLYRLKFWLYRTLARTISHISV